MNKVKKGKKITFRGYEKFSWICAECGREWATKTVAQSCAERKHVNEIFFYYHDDIAKPLNIQKYQNTHINRED